MVGAANRRLVARQANGFESARAGARQQNWLTCCRDDENQATGHAYILEEVNQLNRIKRCADCPPEWMSDEGRRYQEQEQGKRRNAGVDSQDQAQTGDQLQSTPCHNQDGNKVGRNAVSGQFVNGEALADDVESSHHENRRNEYASGDHAISLKTIDWRLSQLVANHT
jgi:hypothetical protein